MSDLMIKDKPTVGISRCLGFCHCRYNGDIVSNRFIKELEPHVHFVTFCPEVDIGLGVPRHPVRLVLQDNNVELYQPAEDQILTDKMRLYAETSLSSDVSFQGFILKGRSPSCGIKDVKIYRKQEKSSAVAKGTGVFAQCVINRYPNLAIEDEGRLTHYGIRDHFLTKLFTLHRFQKVKNSNAMKECVQFHSNHKYLLMAYNQNQLKLMGKIVANHDKKPFDEMVKDYEKHLGLAFSRLPNKNNYINAFLHIFGYFSQMLSSKEKQFILDRLEKYKDNKLHFGVALNLLRTYVIKYEQDYLLDQLIWQAYPEELLDISDSGK